MFLVCKFFFFVIVKVDYCWYQYLIIIPSCRVPSGLSPAVGHTASHWHPASRQCGHHPETDWGGMQGIDSILSTHIVGETFSCLKNCLWPFSFFLLTAPVRHLFWSEEQVPSASWLPGDRRKAFDQRQWCHNRNVSDSFERRSECHQRLLCWPGSKSKDSCHQSHGRWINGNVIIWCDSIILNLMKMEGSEFLLSLFFFQVATSRQRDETPADHL